MTTEKTEKKLTAKARLQLQLDVARKQLVALDAELKPQLAAIDAEIEQLYTESRKAREHSDAVYNRLRDLCDKAQHELSKLYSAQLAKDLRAYAAQNGVEVELLSERHFLIAANSYLGKLVDDRPEIVAASKLHDEAYKACQKISVLINVAESKRRPLVYKLTGAESAVERLEHEIKAIPKRNESQKQRRQEMKVNGELDKLHSAMKTFTWSPPPPPKEGDQCPHGTYWYAEVASENPNWPVGTLDIDCDVCRPEVK